jgi:hypothetical protein
MEVNGQTGQTREQASCKAVKAVSQLAQVYVLACPGLALSDLFQHSLECRSRLPHPSY